MDKTFFDKWFDGLNEGLDQMSDEECSRQSMICVFNELVPERRFHIECIKSILSGDEVCCHRIIFAE